MRGGSASPAAARCAACLRLRISRPWWNSCSGTAAAISPAACSPLMPAIPPDPACRLHGEARYYFESPQSSLPLETVHGLFSDCGVETEEAGPGARLMGASGCSFRAAC